MFSRILSIVLVSCVATAAPAQERFPDFLNLNLGAKEEPLTVSAELVAIDASTAELRVTAELAPNHYIGSMNSDFGGTTKIVLNDFAGLKVVGEGFEADHAPKVVYDETSEQDVEKFFDKVTWSRRLKSETGPLKAGLTVKGQLSGQYCSTGDGSGDGGLCFPIIPPRKFSAQLTELSATETAAAEPAADTKSKSQITIVPTSRNQGPEGSPIKFTIALVPSDAGVGDEVTLNVTADIDRPWHTYSLTQDAESGGGLPTEILLDKVTGLEPIGTEFSASEEPEIESPLEGMVLETHYESVTWSRRFTLTAEQAAIGGTVIFQICNDGLCLPPNDFEFQVALGSSATPATATADEPTAVADADDPAGAGDEAAEVPLMTGDNPAGQGLWAFLLTAVAAGYVALLTPCVFPMIPVTVSFFLKQGETNRGSTLKLAIVYCLGIVGTFTILGLLVAALFGGQALNQLASNPWLNLFFAVVFIFFALMLMGVFELRVPSWMLTWSAKRESAGGVVGVLFMALTFTLVSFTCTFAFVGTLLALASKGDYLWPIVGMLAFSAAFASPFFLLALFPGMLKKLPKSGGWMNRVKVTLGLLELAIVAKFLSVADTGFSATQTAHFLDFSLVVGSWIAISLVTGLYLLGMFSIGHDDNVKSTGPMQVIFALGFMGLGVYMSVGMFAREEPTGVLWQQIAAFAPAQISFSADEEGYYTEQHGLQYALEFDKAVAAARDSGTPLFLEFTGVDCPNCRLMEQNVISRPEVHEVLKKLPRAQLYVDKMPGVPDPEIRELMLERNHELQLDWFGDFAIPSYAIVSPDGTQILSRFRGLASDPSDFQNFLKQGLDEWQQRSRTTTSTTATDSLITVR